MRNEALFYTCSLIEYIGRKKCRTREAVVNKLGAERLREIYRYSDVLHCEPIEKIADEYIRLAKIRKGKFDNISSCRYDVPDYWDIGDVYSRLITDVGGGDVIESLLEVYRSKTSEHIQNFNSALYYQFRDYLAEYYKAGAKDPPPVD